MATHRQGSVEAAPSEQDLPEHELTGRESPEFDLGEFAVPRVRATDENQADSQHPAHGRNELGLDDDIAAHWDLWSTQIGRALMPTLRELRQTIKGFSCAMICTADGFNLCTLGVDEAGVLRLAALTSSMHSIADAVTQAVHGEEDRRLDLLTLTDQNSTIVVLAIRDLIVGKLLLWVATEDETLGALLVHSQRAASRVRELLQVD
jgi:predicted regulator of Ras-like GTPase activity (Roadblock/LC7/MglB family)